MPDFIAPLLTSRWFVLFARLVLTLVFWSGGLAGIFDFGSRVAEMHAAGLAQPETYALAVVAVELTGTALVLINRWSWLGCGMLGVFLMLTIPIGHPFWIKTEPERTQEFFLVLEHISIVGGLMVAAALGQSRTSTGTMELNVKLVSCTPKLAPRASSKHGGWGVAQPTGATFSR